LKVECLGEYLELSFEIKKDELNVKCRILHNDDLHDLGSSHSIFRRLCWIANFARIGGGGGKKCIKNFGAENCFETVICKTEVVRR
jgi:hypothetical protein